MWTDAPWAGLPKYTWKDGKHEPRRSSEEYKTLMAVLEKDEPLSKRTLQASGLFAEACCLKP
jgi:hypothetical protein